MLTLVYWSHLCASKSFRFGFILLAPTVWLNKSYREWLFFPLVFPNDTIDLRGLIYKFEAEVDGWWQAFEIDSY